VRCSQKATAGFSLVEVLVAGALLSIVVVGAFSAIQVSDKAGAIFRENRKMTDWNSTFVRQRALSIEAADLVSVGNEPTEVPARISSLGMALPEGAELHVLGSRVVANGSPLPGLYRIRSTLTWTNASQAPQSSSLSTLTLVQ
jgi:hypothetical protein